jgi:hypothetical protein
MSAVPLLLQVVITPQANCLAVATSSWPRRMTPTFARWLLTTSIHFTCMRRSRKWNASSSQPPSRSDGQVKDSKLIRLWRCGIRQGGVSTQTFFATRRCGEVGFGRYAMLLHIGMVSTTGIGGISRTCGTWASTSFRGQTSTSSLFICSLSSFTHLSNAWATIHLPYFVLPPSLVILVLITERSSAMGTTIFPSLSHRHLWPTSIIFFQYN